MKLNGIEKSKHIASTKNLGKYFPSQFDENVNATHPSDWYTNGMVGWQNCALLSDFREDNNDKSKGKNMHRPENSEMEYFVLRM